ncbi:hypothetical protein [Actinoplanes sichuanensis]|uniref:Uncharacterized protein n=1 Tax=Actinoplanes sichuanensis TaxID=512349 RepID=A0ABW4A8X3_9ACTN|nr:hypothetical protein [Actinoplanes sichuanensis]
MTRDGRIGALGLRLRDPRIAGLAAVAIVDAKGNSTGYSLASGVPGERFLLAPDRAIITTEEFWVLQRALNGRAGSPRRPTDTPRCSQVSESSSAGAGVR